MRNLQIVEKLCYESAACVKRNSSMILSCLAVVGVAATAVMAVKVTPKAVELLVDAKREKGEELTKLEMVKIAGPIYIPVVIVGVSTISCILGAHVLNQHKQTSLLSAYALLSQTHQRYRNAAKTVYGDDADVNIRAQVAKDVYVTADGVSVYTSDIDPDSEKILFYDSCSQRYFNATMASVLNAQYHLNRNLALRGYADVNEFYRFIGIDEIGGGEDVGWRIDNMEMRGYSWLDFENTPSKTDDGLECCIISSFLEPLPLAWDSMW